MLQLLQLVQNTLVEIAETYYSGKDGCVLSTIYIDLVYMSPRGNDLPLRDWEARSQLSTSTDAVLARGSFENNEEGTNHQRERRGDASSFFSRLIAIMSRAPLLGLPSQVQEDLAYGAIPGEPSLFSSRSGYHEQEADDIRKRDKRKAKASGARLSSLDTDSNRRTSRKSNTSSRSKRSWSHSQSHLNSGFVGGANISAGPDGQASMLSGGVVTAVSNSDFDEDEHGGDEEAIEVVDDSDKGSDHDPPDNSPSVSLPLTFRL